MPSANRIPSHPSCCALLALAAVLLVAGIAPAEDKCPSCWGGNYWSGTVPNVDSQQPSVLLGAVDWDNLTGDFGGDLECTAGEYHYLVDGGFITPQLSPDTGTALGCFAGCYEYCVISSLVTPATMSKEEKATHNVTYALEAYRILNPGQVCNPPYDPPVKEALGSASLTGTVYMVLVEAQIAGSINWDEEDPGKVTVGWKASPGNILEATVEIVQPAHDDLPELLEKWIVGPGESIEWDGTLKEQPGNTVIVNARPEPAYVRIKIRVQNRVVTVTETPPSSGNWSCAAEESQEELGPLTVGAIAVTGGCPDCPGGSCTTSRSSVVSHSGALQEDFSVGPPGYEINFRYNSQLSYLEGYYGPLGGEGNAWSSNADVWLVRSGQLAMLFQGGLLTQSFGYQNGPATRFKSTAMGSGAVLEKYDSTHYRLSASAGSAEYEEFEFNASGKWRLSRAHTAAGDTTYTYLSSGFPRISNITYPNGDQVQFSYPEDTTGSGTDRRNVRIAFPGNWVSYIDVENRSPVPYYDDRHVVSYEEAVNGATFAKLVFDTDATVNEAPSYFKETKHLNPAATPTPVELADYRYATENDRTLVRQTLIDGTWHYYDPLDVQEPGSWAAGITDQTTTEVLAFHPAGVRDATYVNTLYDWSQCSNWQSGDNRTNCAAAILTQSTSTVWEGTGLTTSTTSYSGATTTYLYRADQPDATDYDPYNQLQPLRITDPLGNYTSYIYDKPTTATFQNNRQSAMEQRAAGGQLLSRTDYLYDATGEQVTKAYTQDENRLILTASESVYDALGRLRRSLDGEGRATNYVYDASDRIAQVGIGSSTTDYLYDAQDRQKRVRLLGSDGSPLQTTCYDYDVMGNVTAVGVEDVTTSYEYSNGGFGSQLAKVIDSLSHEVRYDYDVKDRLVREELCNTSDVPVATASYTYKPVTGSLASVTDMRGWAREYDYTLLGQPKQIRSFPRVNGVVKPATIDYEYDAFNRLSAIKATCTDLDSAQICQEDIYYQYDRADRLAGRTGIGFGDVAWSFDGAGRPHYFTWPIRQTGAGAAAVIDVYPQRFEYDLANRVTAIYYDGDTSPLVQYGYNRASQLAIMVYETGAQAQHYYDAVYGRLDGIRHSSPDGTVIAAVQYRYNQKGLRDLCIRELGTARTDIAYGYDDWNRLASEMWMAGGNAVYDATYSYDNAGNRLSWSVQGVGQPSKTHYQATYAYQDPTEQANGMVKDVSAPNLLTAVGVIGGATQWKYAWDANGNQTGKTTLVSAATQEHATYQWDSDNRLVQVARDFVTDASDKVVRFVYCPSCGGKRTQKIVWDGTLSTSGAPDRWYRYESEGLNELRRDERYDSNTNGYLDDADAWRTLSYTVHGPGPISHEIKEVHFTYSSATSAVWSSSREFYYHFDALGHVLGISDEDGQTIETYATDAFGVDQNGWSQDTYTTRRLTGKEWDADVGLVNFENRFYDVIAGRFISAAPFRPDQEHPYAIVHNNPAMRVDPTGLMPCTETEYNAEWNKILQELRKLVLQINFYNTTGPYGTPPPLPVEGKTCSIQRWRYLRCEDWQCLIDAKLENMNLCCHVYAAVDGKKRSGYGSAFETHAWDFVGRKVEGHLGLWWRSPKTGMKIHAMDAWEGSPWGMRARGDFISGHLKTPTWGEMNMLWDWGQVK